MNVSNQNINYMRYSKNGYANLKNFVFKQNGNVSWKLSEGAIVPFAYQEITDELKFIRLINSDSLLVLYHDNEIKMSRKSFMDAQFKCIVNPFHFKYQIGDILKLPKSDIVITDIKKENSEWYYFFTCKKCNYHSKVRKGSLEINSSGCPICAMNKVVVGYNDFNTLYPELSQKLVDINDGNMPKSSKKNVKWKCDKCDNVVTYPIKYVAEHGFICPYCTLKFSFGENVIYNLLSDLKITFQHQKTFEWAINKSLNHLFYDFYVPDKNCIVEVHGLQHYQKSKFEDLGGRTLEEEIENDNYKKMIALKNGITNYIVIDARKSNINYIKESIFNNKDFCMLFNLSDIKCDIQLKNINHDLYKKIITMWNDGKNIDDISKTYNVDRHKVKQLLDLSVKNNHTNYSTTESRQRAGKQLHIKSYKKKNKPIQCIENQLVFSSIMICSEYFSSKLKIPHIENNMTRSIKRNHKNKGYTFKYISCEEFNEIKVKSPNLAFGSILT